MCYDEGTAILRGGRAGGFGFAGGESPFTVAARGGDAGALSGPRLSLVTVESLSIAAAAPGAGSRDSRRLLSFDTIDWSAAVAGELLSTSGE